MKKLNFLIQDAPTIWTKIPRKADDALDYLYQKLIEDNEAILALADKKGCGYFEKPVRKKVSPAQEVLLLIYRLDSQILNGGITQFIWNSAGEFDDVEKAIKKLRQLEFARLYKKMADHADSRFEQFEPLYVKGHEVGGKIGMDCFRKTYSVFGLKWFDKEYLSKHRAKLVQALVDFIVKNKKEFVR
jgi:hypothetical protein